MNKTIPNTTTPLQHLCRYLYSEDKTASDRHFTHYYRSLVGTASNPGLYHFIRWRLACDRRTHEDPDKLAEDLLHRLLEQHLRQIRDECPEAAECVYRLAATLALPARGETFKRQIAQWTQPLTAWTERTLQFYYRHAANLAVGDAETEAEHINRQWPPLWNGGAALLAWAEPGDGVGGNEVSPTEEQDEPAMDDEKIDPALRDCIRSLVASVNKQAQADGEAASDRRLGVAGGSRFVHDTGELLGCGGKLQIPIPAFLYYRAQKLIGSHFKLKCNSNEQTVAFNSEEDNETDMYQTFFEKSDNSDSDEGDAFAMLEEAQFLLNAPLREAEAELASTRGTSKKAAAQAKVEKRRVKCQRLLIMFEFMILEGKDYTQEKAAAKLGLTRDKIRTLETHFYALLAPLDI